MANNKILTEEKSRDIGNFLVGRLLPFKEKRQVGPFTFIDHMGPSTIGPGAYMDVDQHPHIGLSTLTYMLEGEVGHRDSTGADVVIQPGSVNFMTAGKGVTHTERTPDYMRDGSVYNIHGYQIWVALPKELEDMEPNFVHLPSEALPKWEHNGMSLTLVAGEGYGRKSPLPVYSELFMLDVSTDKPNELLIEGQLEGEIAIVVVKGRVEDDGEIIEQGQMLISKTENECKIKLADDTQVLLFGGKPLENEVFLLWNFASSSKDKLQKAKEDWKNKRFPKVPGDDTYIPMPG